MCVCVPKAQSALPQRADQLTSGGHQRAAPTQAAPSSCITLAFLVLSIVLTFSPVCVVL